ncbi:MAG: ABC transporter permease [Spirochaetaceae bacterium]|nr:ABC transporter permease [Spirochaetaceae bacterium]MDE0227516.1 ABC transporter permease [Spirochaetaceae bacterium]
MFDYIIRRTLQIIPLIIIISVLSFAIIELPPGDFVTMRIIELEQTGTRVDDDEIARLTEQYGLDKTLVERYALWTWNIISRGHLGRSFQWEQPVTQVIGERIALTMSISLLTLIFIWVVAIPIGIYAATHQYSLGDYIFTFFGFIGISVPGFLLALVVMYLAFTQLGVSVTGLFSPEFADAPWSFAKLMDMLPRLWVPIVVIGLTGTASLIRVMRSMMLDELRKQYVVTARAKGVAERTLLFKYPVRIAINPLISTIGWLLPFIVSGEALVSIVLNLPTTGPVLLRALLFQDMYLAGSLVMILSVLTVVGTLMSDLLLAWVDPRIRYQAATR